MALPDETKLKALLESGDAPTDALVERLAEQHGLPALGALLDMLIFWDSSKAPAPPSAFPGVPAEVMTEASAFLLTPGHLDDAFPGGVDWERVRRAQDFFAEHQSLGLLILGCGSLPACYSIPGVAQVLIGSGKLVVQVTSRLAETIAFLTKVMTPGSLGPGDGAFEGNLWIRKVRLMHAVMRCLMVADPHIFSDLPEDRPSHVFLKFDWAKRATKEDFPINQVELGFVLLTFSWMVVRGLRLLWVRMNEEQANDHLYTWAVIGHGLGIDVALRPHTAEDAEGLFESIRDRYEEGTLAGRLLVAALVVYIISRLREGVRQMLPPPLLRILVTYFRRFGSGCLESLARTFVRALSGADTANKLWVPRAPFIHWLAGLVVRGGILLKDALTPGVTGDKGISRLLGDNMTPPRPPR